MARKEWAVLEYADQMTKGVEVEDGLVEGLREWFNDKEVVEVTATIAAYNCVSRFLVALDVGENNGHTLTTVEQLVKQVEGQ